MRAYMLIARAIERDRLTEAAEARLAAEAGRNGTARPTQWGAPRTRFGFIRSSARVGLSTLASAAFGINVK